MKWIKNNKIDCYKGRVFDFIIFGTRGVTSTKKTGEFYCPSCEINCTYNHREVKRYGTLYFIPLMPMDNLGDYIECAKCKNTYNEKVLEYKPEATAEEFQAEYDIAIKKIMIMMLLADGIIDDQEIETIKDLYQRITSKTITTNQLNKEIKEVQSHAYEIIDYTASLRGNLNDQGKELIVKAAFYVAYADGEFHETEQNLLIEIGESLDLTATHIKGILAELNEQ